jgi:hypothetical protein
MNKEEFDYKEIKTFEDACKRLNINVNDFNENYENLDIGIYSNESYGGTNINVLAHKKLIIIFAAINDGWFAKYGGDNYGRYCPYHIWNDELLKNEFKFSGNGIALSYFDIRLFTNSKEKSDYIGLTFIDIYNEMFKNANFESD